MLSERNLFFCPLFRELRSQFTQFSLITSEIIPNGSSTKGQSSMFRFVSPLDQLVVDIYNGSPLLTAEVL
jgi:hypothetical protein